MPKKEPEFSDALERKAQKLLEKHGRFVEEALTFKYTANTPFGHFSATDPRDLKVQIMKVLISIK